MKTIIKIVCSWCGKDMGQKDGKGISGVSHGMCEDCLRKLVEHQYPDKAILRRDV